MVAVESVQPETVGQGVTWTPNSVQVFCGKTSHSESEAFVPADAFQSLFPCVTEHFLTKVWSLVALLTPATLQPEPGSPFQSPSQSITV